MSYLNAKQRKALPKSDFAIPEKAPGSGSYPIEDKKHAKAALSRGSENASPAEMTRIRAKVHEEYPGIKQSAGRYKHK